MRRARGVPTAAGIVAVALLPLVGDLVRGGRARCAVDGVEIAPAFRVRAVDRAGDVHSFCGVECAQRWLGRHDPPRRLLVTDCASGREIDAAHAWYVRAVATYGEGAPDPIRVFASLNEAERFASAYGGDVLARPPLERAHGN